MCHGCLLYPCGVLPKCFVQIPRTALHRTEGGLNSRELQSPLLRRLAALPRAKLTCFQSSMCLILLATWYIIRQTTNIFQNWTHGCDIWHKGTRNIALYRIFDKCFDNLDHLGECDIRTDRQTKCPVAIAKNNTVGLEMYKTLTNRSSIVDSRKRVVD